MEKKIKMNIIDKCLSDMTRDELRATATALNVKRGKDRKDTIANLASAIEAGKAGLTIQFTIRQPRLTETSFAAPVFSKKFRTHRPDKVIVTPSTAPAPLAPLED